ncbi:MAG: Mut7-C RNAse domain-containing protein [Candidatus Brockarchaeota archaeon]|nr:Mut7-C RNAse domain-containing protein [Candidatus Brockarchaeota archaeon]
MADGMLGDVARWLRIMGYDTLYFGDMDDGRILESSAERVLLTSDEQLYRRALKLGIDAFLVPGGALSEKLRTIVRRYGLSSASSGSRCTSCNGVLVPASRERIKSSKEAPPPLVEEVWACPDCGKLYWKGSHWKGIGKALQELAEPST